MAEGIKIFIDYSYLSILQVVLDLLKQNHMYQRRVVDLLWADKQPTINDYEEGIKHIHSFSAIGPMAALLFANAAKKQDIIDNFSVQYGVALQYLDDLSEIDEDVKNKYWSLPRILSNIEGSQDKITHIDVKNKLIKKLKIKGKKRINNALSSLPSNWINKDALFPLSIGCSSTISSCNEI